MSAAGEKKLGAAEINDVRPADALKRERVILAVATGLLASGLRPPGPVFAAQVAEYADALMATLT